MLYNSIIYIKYQTSGGYVVHIYSKELNMTSEFGHLKKGSIKVKLHDIVETGSIIAKMGNTGKVTGYHLHYGLYKGKLNYNKKDMDIIIDNSKGVDINEIKSLRKCISIPK